MDINSREALFVIFIFVFLAWGNAQDNDALVPAIITFGDSAVDVGNNNYFPTIFKADYPPYGRDFINHQPTGRFCNGKLATDITAETLGFKSYAPAYLSPQASGKNLLILEQILLQLPLHAIPLSQQLQYYKEYQSKLAKIAGNKKAASIIKGALYILSAGSSDFVQNYYVNPLINKVITPDQYSAYLVDAFSSFVKDLYRLGARKATSYDLVVFNIYKTLYDLVQSPTKFGFAEARRGCCGTGIVETTSLLCNPKSIGTCSNATQYVFWDAVHPSQAANQDLADALTLQGIGLITPP